MDSYGVNLSVLIAFAASIYISFEYMLSSKPEYYMLICNHPAHFKAG